MQCIVHIIYNMPHWNIGNMSSPLIISVLRAHRPRVRVYRLIRDMTSFATDEQRNRYSARRDKLSVRFFYTLEPSII